MGTVAGVNTRRYHGLLVASLHPPVRALCAAVPSRRRSSIGRCARVFASIPESSRREGSNFSKSFEAIPARPGDSTSNGATLEKQVYLIPGRQAVVIRYRADREVDVSGAPFLAYRDYHSLGQARLDPFGSLPQLEFRSRRPVRRPSRLVLQRRVSGGTRARPRFPRGFVFTRRDRAGLEPGEWTPICASIDGATYAEPAQRADPFLVAPRRWHARPSSPAIRGSPTGAAIR